MAGFFLLALGGLLLYRTTRTDRILSGIHAGPIPVGNQTKSDAVLRIRSEAERFLAGQTIVQFETASGTREFVIRALPENATGLISIDPEKEAEILMAYGKTGSLWSRLSASLIARLFRPSIPFRTIEIDTPFIETMLPEHLSQYETGAEDATVRFESLEPLRYSIETDHAGVEYRSDEAVAVLKNNWSRLSHEPIKINRVEIQPAIRTPDVQMITPLLETIVSDRKVSFVAFDPISGVTTTWDAGSGMIAGWLKPGQAKNAAVRWTVDSPAFHSFLNTNIIPVLAVAPQNAKFRINADGQADEFQHSAAGQSVDVSSTITFLDELLTVPASAGATSSVPIVVQELPPSITTKDTNTLGIEEKLGTGSSNFFGSPVNRRKNIALAVDKLDGILIAPDEIFSALEHMAPFTTTSGYVPELVIKGDALKPEIGGGLCQIGTTLFRMAMNSGLPIVKRQNHSLVVQYYSDPRNGNPGTDATIMSQRRTSIQK